MMSQKAVYTARWADDRLGLAHWTKKAMNKIFPDHWSFMIGEIALYSFTIVIITGVYLTFFFDPSLQHSIYNGPYRPIDGQSVSHAYASVVNLSLFVRGGLVIRQMHHWSADIFVAAIVVHMMRIFFTGAFRRPRELNWLIGVTLLFLSIVNGYVGYSLPDDLISGTGVRIAFSIFLAIPVVGTYFAFFFFGGNFPGTAYDFRFFIAHVLLIPGIIIGLLGAHLAMIWHQKHTQFAGGGATETNVVGSPVWPTYAFKSTGFFLITFGIIAGLGGLAQINPIWLYGPYVPYKVTYLVQPDWYMGWLDGALRLMPAWETHLPSNHMVPNAFWPAIFLPGFTAMLLYSWPFLEAHFTKENRRDHNLLDRPRDRPLRTAIGAATFAFYGVLFLGSATDLLAQVFSVSLNAVLWSLRFVLLGAPIVVGFGTHFICKEMSKVPEAGKRKRSSIIVRASDGGYALREADVRPGDESIELEPEEVPTAFMGRAAQLVGAAMVGDGAGDGDGSGNGGPTPGEAVVGQATAASQVVLGEERGRGGVLQAPRAPVPRARGGLLGRRRRPGNGAVGNGDGDGANGGGPPANGG